MDVNIAVYLHAPYCEAECDILCMQGHPDLLKGVWLHSSNHTSPFLKFSHKVFHVYESLQ